MNILRAVRSANFLARKTFSSVRPFSQSQILLVKEDELHKEIQNAFPEGQISVEDASNGCGTNFNIQVVCDSFDGKRAVNRNRMVNKVIKPYMEEIHMIRVETFTKAEFSSS